MQDLSTEMEIMHDRITGRFSVIQRQLYTSHLIVCDKALDQVCVATYACDLINKACENILYTANITRNFVNNLP